MAVIQRKASEADFTFKAKEYTDEFRVWEFSGTEGISELFRYKIKLDAVDSKIDFNSIVGKPACISVYGETGDRFIHGIVSRFTQDGTGSKYTVYNAELVPQIWSLNLRHKSQIFQDMTVENIIKKVFEDANIQSDVYKFELQGNHEAREYCVQYRESDFNFISRLMEEEGIFYFFEHNEDGHVMIIADSSSIHVPIESPNVTFNEQSGMVAEHEAVYAFRFAQQMKTGSAMLKDFDFKNPENSDTLLEAITSVGDNEDGFEFYDYPGRYYENSIGNDWVKLRLEAIRMDRQAGFGKSVCRRFIAGYRFTLEDNPRSDFNQEYLIIRLITSATQPLGEDMSGGEPTFDNEFECIPYSVPFRPIAKTLKPIVTGVQTAIVVGPSGEDIYTDEYGRVKVQFHWDREGQRNEDSSCWIRVSQNWAGPSWGAMFIPRIGHEVIVDFLEGDPDRPIITGSVYNGGNMPPYALPNDKTKSTIKSDSSIGGKGFNEIRFEDNKGNEQVFIHAEKNQDNRVKNDSLEWIGRDRHLIIKRDQFELVEGDGHFHIKGDHNEKVDSTISIKADKDIQEKAGANYALDAGTEIHLKAGTNLVIESGSSLTLKVGGNFVNINSGGVFIKGAMVMINSGGSAGTGSGSSPDEPKDPLEADKAKPGEKAELLKPRKREAPPKPEFYGVCATMMKQAAENGTPFVDTYT